MVESDADSANAFGKALESVPTEEGSYALRTGGEARSEHHEVFCPHCQGRWTPEGLTFGFQPGFALALHIGKDMDPPPSWQCSTSKHCKCWSDIARPTARDKNHDEILQLPYAICVACGEPEHLCDGRVYLPPCAILYYQEIEREGYPHLLPKYW
jgi:hypothetical protein